MSKSARTNQMSQGRPWSNIFLDALCTCNLQNDCLTITNLEASWKEFEDVYSWIVKTKGYEPLVIDADDLQKDPGEKTARSQILVFLECNLTGLFP